jgi:precorrin-6B methylase 1
MTGSESASRGRLIVVGTGIQLGRHVSQRVLSEIEQAEVVFGLADEFALDWLRQLRPDAIPLAGHYADGKDRRQTYREMEARILEPVRAGRQVCAVFYGHPGVFADVPHVALRKARAEGHAARMEPGISAEACLYADLGLDPGRRGVQSFEATQYLIYQRRVDPTAMLILWQVALVGDLSCTRFEADPARLQVLVDKLLRDYPPETGVILYEAARLPVVRFRAEHLRLTDLPTAVYKEYSTLVILPVAALEPDSDALAALGQGTVDGDPR